MATKMTQTNPYELGKQAVRDAVSQLLKDADWDGAGSLPSDFADTLFDLAWKHRVEPSSPNSMREMKAYIKSLFPDEITT